MRSPSPAALALALVVACSASPPTSPPAPTAPVPQEASRSDVAPPQPSASAPASELVDASLPQNVPARDAGAVDAADAGAEAAAPTPPPRHAFHAHTPSRIMPTKAPAMRYANLSPARCQAELKRRKLNLKRWHGAAKGVATPLRFDGSIAGISYVAPRGKSPYGILDCRLALALDELAKVLKRHNVVQVRLDNIYRPGAKLPGRRHKSQHAHGLAADITVFKLADGRQLSVEDHWLGERGDPPCGPEASINAEVEEAILLRNIYCEVANLGLFHTMLSPGHDEAHRDHFHWDIKRDAKYRSVR